MPDMRFHVSGSNRGIILLKLLFAVMLPGLTSCSSDEGGKDSSGNIAWITIQSSSINVNTDGTASAYLSGKAFVSPDYVAHKCVGIGCILGWFDDSYPGVNVTWHNLTNGAQGTATSRYGTATNWEHLWYANVPLTVGINNLRVTASDPAGNSASANVSFDYIPPAPADLRANTGNSEITLLWSPVQGATSYRLYWANYPGTAFSQGTVVDVNASPYVHSGLANGTTYYYAISSRYLTNESLPSAEIAATAGAPLQPSNLMVSVAGTDVQLNWDAVATADTYSIYWANESGVTTQTGTQIPLVASPYIHTGLSGIPYYYIVTAINGYGESLATEEVMAFPPLAPSAPTGLSALQRSWGTTVDLAWYPVPGAYGYDVYRCWAWANSTPDGCSPSTYGCYEPWVQIGSGVGDTFFVDWTTDTVAYWYYVTARNPYGSSVPSDWAGLCVEP